MSPLIALAIEHGTLLVFVVALAGRIGAPVPAAALLVVVGAVSASGQISIPASLAASIAANLLGDAAWFWAGRARGHRVLRFVCKIARSPDACVHQSEGFMRRWGGSSLLAAKFLPGVSLVAPPLAGAIGMSIAAFVGFDLAAAAIWSALFLGLGRAFGSEFLRLIDMLSAIGGALLIASGLAVAGCLSWRYAKRRNESHGFATSPISAERLRELIESGRDPMIIDVRSEVGRSHDPRRLPGAIELALDELARHVDALPREREIVVYCGCPNDATAVRAARILAGRGFLFVRTLAGGLDAWSAAAPVAEFRSLGAVGA